jgi:hypothetical protein
MNEEQWDKMTNDQQMQHCWQELTRMLISAQPPPYEAGNSETVVVPGLTTLVVRYRGEGETL